MRTQARYHPYNRQRTTLQAATILVSSLRATSACLLCGVAGVAVAQDAAMSPPECRCRAPDGQMQSLGAVQCMTIVGRPTLVRCEMSTNTPYWNKVEGVEGCPDA